MIQINAIGDTCPIPVVKTLNAIKELKTPDVYVYFAIPLPSACRPLRLLGYGLAPKLFRVLSPLTGGEFVQYLHSQSIIVGLAVL